VDLLADGDPQRDDRRAREEGPGLQNRDPDPGVPPESPASVSPNAYRGPR